MTFVGFYYYYFIYYLLPSSDVQLNEKAHNSGIMLIDPSSPISKNVVHSKRKIV